MKKYFMFAILALVSLISFTSCTSVTPNPGEVAVLVDKPWIFGEGGVRSEVWGTGRQYTWPSTSYVIYETAPSTYEEHFENVVTKDNNPINFSSYIKIAVLGDSAWYLHSKFLKEWYKNNISPKFRTMVRDNASPYEMFQLTSQREILVKIEQKLKDDMIAYCKTIKIPVSVLEVNVGSVQPQPEVLKEIAETAAKVQNQKTQIAEGKAQDERKVAEEKRAIADMAYKNKMGLSNDQFIQLEYTKILDKAAGGGSTFVIGQVPGLTLTK